MQHRLKVVEITGNFVKAEVFRNPLHAPGLGAGFKRADQQFARIVFVVSASVVIPEYRQLRVQPLYRFEQHVIVLAGMERQVDPD